MENVSPIITAKNLNLWYGDFKALKDISLDMGEREITALIGPSGSHTLDSPPNSGALGIS